MTTILLAIIAFLYATVSIFVFFLGDDAPIVTRVIAAIVGPLVLIYGVMVLVKTRLEGLG